MGKNWNEQWNCGKRLRTEKNNLENMMRIVFNEL